MNQILGFIFVLLSPIVLIFYTLAAVMRIISDPELAHIDHQEVVISSRLLDK